MVRFHLTLLFAIAAPVVAARAEPLDVALHRKLAEGGSWFTPAERRFIADRCGQRDEDHLRIEGDRLFCANGRVVRDPYVRVMARDVQARASVRARVAVDSPEVRAAIQATVDRNVRGAMARRGLAPDR